ncbi:plasminogen activator sPA-like protein [Dinothrombium tinctorium]|uniref:Acrosin n=1 Tax=Dinothrombium tinctorium TaxID=1965070 RepID=A0A443QE22_9ACAR|nr:plasminogen activator sPA-like protein [Dinothrombium tinctorium]
MSHKTLVSCFYVFATFLVVIFASSQQKILRPDVKRPAVRNPTTNVSALNSKTCGLGFSMPSSTKIVGGREALPGEFPWQVSLQIKRFSSNYMHYCGAVVLNSRTLITAAHCLNNINKNDIRAVLGAHNIRKYSGDEVMPRISKLVIHDKYNERTMANDIGLIILEREVDLSHASGRPINSVCIPNKQETFKGELIVSGWGRTAENGGLPDKLRAVEVPVISNDECGRYYRFRIHPCMVCAGHKEGGKDSCQGDSGGPIVQRVDGRSKLVGVVSWGIGCARPRSPGVYTEVSCYNDWIEQNSK